jgi:hypothetical protein
VHGRELLDTAAVPRNPTLKFAFVISFSSCDVASPRMALEYVVITAYKNLLRPVRCCDLAAAV